LANLRWLAALCVLFIAVSVSGCALIEAEKDNRGGFLDKAADDLWMKADSKRMRALRALAIEASLARIAMIAPKSAPDRALLARRIGNTTLRADAVRKCAFGETVLPGQVAGEPCFIFDSVMVDYENALFDLALVSLPLEDARNLITRVSGGVAAISVNPLLLVQALLDIGREAFRYGRVVGAIYRDTMELEVQVWLASPQLANFERARGLPEAFVVTDERVAALRGAYVLDNDNIPVWRAEMAALRAQGLQPVPDPRFLTQIFGILTYICGQIVSTTDDSYEECARPKLTRGMPVLSVATTTVFRPITVSRGGTTVIRSPGGGATSPGRTGPATSRDTADRVVRNAPVTLQDYKEIIQDYDGSVHTIARVEPILIKLCVPGNELRAIGARAKVLIQVYQQAVSDPVTGQLTRRELTRLGDVRDCPVDRRNYYEANLMPAGLSAPDVIEAVNLALAPNRKLPPNATVQDIRSRLPEARAAVARDLKLQSPLLADQFTPDLFVALANR
jgi:hypothetical protein